MEVVHQRIVSVLQDPVLLLVWLTINGLCVVWLLYDLRTANPQTQGLMRWVWILTVAYSGPLGLLVYVYSGRAQIRRDSLWRRAFRSVSHCYAGCGVGEIAGVIIAAGILSLGALAVSVTTFTLAYVAGFAFTIGPLMAMGMGFGVALRDTVVSETISITAMEVTAISVDLWLGQGATMFQPLFWTALLTSLSAGLLAAYPVNILLIRFGIKEGMGHPAEGHAHCH
ncbi:DUF4396 domain-containing protein [uncultured Rhodospira sp.]|uniref:DUF4396 domain-containing protein n=1 Tax=uncultured Rhodospira sp. TaxID=1936189 RepID=UPI00261F972F|nr:DUF4396 domain-containing protein [uncultured Rhodospira sp.]